MRGDTLHTQKTASKLIGAAGGDYIWYTKGYQSQMEEDIRLWFEPDPDPIPGQGRLLKDFKRAEKINKGHGRIEVRKITVSSQLKDFFDWPYIEQVFKLEQRFTEIKLGRIREQEIYGFTSLSRDQITPADYWL